MNPGDVPVIDEGSDCLGDVGVLYVLGVVGGEDADMLHEYFVGLCFEPVDLKGGEGEHVVVLVLVFDWYELLQ